MKPSPAFAVAASSQMPDAGLPRVSVGPSPALVNVIVNLNQTASQSSISHLPTSNHLPTFSPSQLFTPSTPSLLHPFTPRRRPAAFTLIELMVATAITSLLLLGMTGIFDQAMKAWQLSSRRGDAEREIRAALSQIERDLSGAVVNARTPIYINVIGNTRVNIPNPFSANLPLRVGNQGVDWQSISAVLFFASAQPSQAGQVGDVAGIGYFVAWDTNSNAGNGAWNLYRRYQSPADLHSAVVARAALPTLNLNSPGPYQINTNSTPEIVAANVLNFWIAPVVFDTNVPPTPRTLPTNSSGNLDFAALGTGFWITNRPAYFQLELTGYGSEQVRGFVGGTETARKAMWGNTNNITKFGRSFIWRVDL